PTRSRGPKNCGCTHRPYTLRLRLRTGRLYISVPGIAIGPIALPRRVATALRRRAARRATPTERPHSEGGYNLSVSQREFEQFHLDTARTPACRKALLAPGSCAHIPISARSFRSCATDDRKSLLASAAWGFQAAPISCQSRCAAIEPNWVRQSRPLETPRRDARDRA